MLYCQKFGTKPFTQCTLLNCNNKRQRRRTTWSAKSKTFKIKILCSENTEKKGSKRDGLAKRKSKGDTQFINAAHVYVYNTCGTIFIPTTARHERTSERGNK